MRGLWLVLLLCTACGSEPPAAAPSRTPAAGSGAISSAAMRCTPGNASCFCPDGSQSGTQVCDARGQLGVCQCNTSSVQLGVMSQPTELCAELKGMTSCAAQSYVSPQLPASVLFVVDRSGSMACNAPPVQTVESCNADPKRLDASKPSRWEITTSALTTTFQSIMAGSTAAGLSMFSTDGYCGVDSTPVVGVDPIDSAQQQALTDAMRQAEPAGGTPIVGSMISAYHHLHEELHAVGNRYVVLITDGEESCGMAGNADDKADLLAARTRLLQTEVQKARMANIRTFVVGTPGSEGARGFLSELAFQGGTARNPSCMHGDANAAVGDCHFDLTMEQDFARVLQTTLGTISNEARGCEFQTPAGGGDSLNVQVRTSGAAPRCLTLDNRDCSTAANGFQYAKRADGSMDYGRVVLCGQACASVKADTSAVVDVILGCPILQ